MSARIAAIVGVTFLGLVSGAMRADAQVFKVGNFSKSTTVVSGCASGCPTDVITHNLGVTPTAMILWSVGKTNSSFSGSFLWAFGMTDGTAAGTRVGSAGSVNASPNSKASRNSAAKIIKFLQGGGTGTVLAEADFTSWDSSTFTITWTTNDSNAYVIHYLLIGGSSTAAKVWTYASASSNSTVTQTGATFQPDLVLNMNHGFGMGFSSIGGVVSSNITAANAGFGLGVMDAGGNQWTTGFLSVDSAGTMDTQRGQQTNATFYSFNGTLASTKTGTCVAPCMTADGFGINFALVGADISGVMSSLGLHNVNFAIGKFNKSTTSASGCSSGCPTNTIGGLAFQPSVVILTSFQDITQASAVANSRFGFGVSDGTNEASAALTDFDAASSSNVWAIDKTTKAFIKVNNNNASNGTAPVIDAEADVTMNSNGFTATWTTNDTVATEMLYLALGPLNVTSVTLASFTAEKLPDGNVRLEWHTGYEVDNIGFRVYREQNGKRVRVSRSLIRGTAVIGRRRKGGETYTVSDSNVPTDAGPVQYWLEDIDLKGKSTWHGPILATDAERKR